MQIKGYFIWFNIRKIRGYIKIYMNMEIRCFFLLYIIKEISVNIKMYMYINMERLEVILYCLILGKLKVI